MQQKTDQEYRELAIANLCGRVSAFEARENERREKATIDGKYLPVAPQTLYNYVLSLLNVEFYKLPKEDREMVLNKYK